MTAGAAGPKVGSSASEARLLSAGRRSGDGRQALRERKGYQVAEAYDQTISDAEEAARVKAELKIEAAKQWRYWGVADNAAFAATVANLTPPQQAGEAVFSVRDDGKVDLFLFY